MRPSTLAFLALVAPELTRLPVPSWKHRAKLKKRINPKRDVQAKAKRARKDGRRNRQK